MTSRREDILDAAIRILGQSGMHALSHRAVDNAAELPAGSTSNYFRTRSALLESVVERFADRERETWEDIELQYPTSPEDLSKLLAGFVRTALDANRELTMARYVVLLEAAMQPALREAVARTGSRVTASGTNWMRSAGSSHPGRDVQIIGAHIDGMVLHNLFQPDPTFDPLDEITALVGALIPSPAPTEG